MRKEPPSLKTPKQAIIHALRYSNFFNYPLTTREVWYWSPKTPAPQSSQTVKKVLGKLIREGALEQSGEFYFLPHRQGLVARRKKCEKLSKGKWQIAYKAAAILVKIPTVQALAVTGSLAMNNCDKDADIDLMLVVSPHTLWLTRLFTWLLLSRAHLRRAPLTNEPHRIKDKVCDNVYLDSSDLNLASLFGFSSRSFYLAHEILQAKPLFDRSSAYTRFLKSNSWAGDLLPNAYRECFRQPENNSHLDNLLIRNFFFLLSPLNFLLFVLQYLFMKPKMTNETVSLKRAFFHPSTLPLSGDLGSY